MLSKDNIMNSKNNSFIKFKKNLSWTYSTMLGNEFQKPYNKTRKKHLSHILLKRRNTTIKPRNFKIPYYH